MFYVKFTIENMWSEKHLLYEKKYLKGDTHTHTQKCRYAVHGNNGLMHVINFYFFIFFYTN